MKKVIVYSFAVVAAAAFAFSGITKSNNGVTSLTELKAKADKVCESSSSECETSGGVYSKNKAVAPQQQEIE